MTVKTVSPAIYAATPHALAVVCLALLGANLVARLLVATTLPLSYMETYHWQWSQALAGGYLDDPPVIAWLIRITTGLFGERSALAVRLGPLGFGTASYGLIYWIAFQVTADRRVAWSAVLIGLCLPLVAMMGITSLPESPLIFFHLLSLGLLFAALRRDGILVWLAFGATLGLALMSKLVGGLIVVALLVFLFGSRSGRRRQLGPRFGLALVAALAVFAPFLAWNLEHDWASIRLQLWDRHVERFGFGLDKLIEYGLEQLINAPLLLVPILAVLVVRPGRFPAPWQEGIRLLRWQAIVPLAAFACLGGFAGTHPQRTVIAYAPAAILLAAWWHAGPGRWPFVGLRTWIGVSQAAVLAVAASLVFALPLVASIDPDRLPHNLGSGLSKAKRQMLGLDTLAGDLEQRFAEAGIAIDTVGRRAGDGVPILLFGPDKEISSPLAFAWPHGPVVNVPAVTADRLRLGGAQRFTLAPEIYVGGRGIAFGPTSWAESLGRYFVTVEERDPVEQRYAGRLIARYRTFLVTGFDPDGRP